MAISKKEIESTILAKGFKPKDITTYKNLSSAIIIECKQGHEIITDFASIRKDNFVCPSCEGKQSSNLRIDHTLPPKSGYRIIALDQSSKKIGVSVFDDGKLVYYHLFEVTGDLGDRLVKIYNLMHKVIIKEWQPNYLVFEDVYKDNPLTYKVLSMVMGICILAAEQYAVEHTELINKTWQSEFNIGGTSRTAQKKNVISRVKEYYDLDVNDDVADAILMGKYAAKRLSDKWGMVIF